MDDKILAIQENIAVRENGQKRLLIPRVDLDFLTDISSGGEDEPILPPTPVNEAYQVYYTPLKVPWCLCFSIEY